MGDSALQRFLAEQGLWLAPVADAVRAMGFESVADLQCCFRSRECAHKRGGPASGLGWLVASQLESADLSTQVLEAVEAHWRESAAVAALRCPPALTAAEEG